MFKRLSLFASVVFFVLFGIPFAHADFSTGAAAIDLLGQYNDSLTNPQPVYTKAAADNGPNQLGFYGPSFSAIDTVHHRLFVSDSVNNRVLVYTLTSTNNISVHIPSYVLGQANFYTIWRRNIQSSLWSRLR